jgi:predicted short-subunit dehydrogenase-like oxidoreductase (DUF2520 family)
MKIGFIGAGKLGFSLGKYLMENNINVSGYYSKNLDSSKEAAIFTNSKYYESLKSIIDDCDTIFITTQDGVISEIWDSISQLSINNKIICHCSGSLSSNIFSNIEDHGAYGYSIHPMIAFSDKYNSHKQLKHATITIEGVNDYLDTFKDMFKSLGNKVKVISKNNKAKYHAASVFVSNHVIALFNTGIELLSDCGFTEEEARESLYPLMINNIKNIGQNGIVNSLTGPIERGDIGTIEKHLLALNKENKELYILLSKKLIEIAKVKNNNKDYSTLEKMIGD